MRLLSHPVTQFLIAGAVALLGVVWATSYLASKAAMREAVGDARGSTQILASSVAEPALPRGLVSGSAGAIDRFDRTVLSRLQVDNVVRIKIWDRHGRVVYSDAPRLIGDRYALGEEEKEVIVEGGVDAEFSDLSRPENRFEVDSGGALEVYTRIRSPEGEPLLFEVYFSADHVAQRQHDVMSAFRVVTLGGLLLLITLATPLVWLLARRLAAARNDRERMLRTAIEASDVERRRISRDLHDGVVQDLAGASYTLAATARTLADSRPETSATLAAQASSIRSALRSLRSLLVEIYPADLHEHGLAAALEDLVAPAAGAGIDVGLTVGDTEELPPEVAALVWRVAQEAVRNALRHAAPTTLRVTVTGPADGTRGGQCDLVVVDDGAGFDPSRPTPAGHLGLRAMRDLVAEAGGRLRIDSVVGAGTTVRLTVPTP